MARIRLCLVSCKAKRCNQVCCRWQRRTLRPHQCGELTKATTYAANPPNSARNNAKICLKYATSLRHFLLDLTGDVPGCAENLHIDPQTTFGRTCPKYYQLDPVCIGISESKFLTRMKWGPENLLKPRAAASCIVLFRSKTECRNRNPTETQQKPKNAISLELRRSTEKDTFCKKCLKRRSRYLELS